MLHDAHDQTFNCFLTSRMLQWWPQYHCWAAYHCWFKPQTGSDTLPLPVSLLVH